MTPTRASRIAKECMCGFAWTPAIGTHDTVTGEWLPDKPTVHVRLDRHPECPWHPYWYLGNPIRLVEDLGDGWGLFRWSDGKVWKHWMAQTGIEMNFGQAQRLLPINTQGDK